MLNPSSEGWTEADWAEYWRGVFEAERGKMTLLELSPDYDGPYTIWDLPSVLY